MWNTLLVMTLAVMASGPTWSAASTAGGGSSSNWKMPDTFSMQHVTMNVLEPQPADMSQPSTLEGASIDGSKLNSTQLTDAIVELIASEMQKAGLTADDIRGFVKNETGERSDEVGNDSKMPTANSDNMESVDGTDSEGRTTGGSKLDDRDEDERSNPGVKQDEYKEDDKLGSPRHPKLVGAANPSGTAGDVFHNGTDFFKWLEDLMNQVEDRMAKDGSTADPIAQNERPGLMDGKNTRDGSQEPTNSPISSDSTKDWNSQNSERNDGKPNKSGDSKGLTWDKRKSNHHQPPNTDRSKSDGSSSSSERPNDSKDWKQSELKHGGFDNIPKAVPMIVMSGNTYIKDIGNFRNMYQYGNLPVKLRTIEPNGNDSGIQLDSGSEDETSDEANTRKHLLKAKRDGNSRGVDRLLRMVAQFIKIHGHDDGESGDSPTDDAQQPRHGGNNADRRQNDHQNNAGDSQQDNGRPPRDPRHDDGNTYHSSVHGHDDGDSTGARGLLRSPAGSHDNLHGHDDGSTYNPKVHGHDDQGSGGRGGGRENSDDLHGHDDGQTHNGDANSRDTQAATESTDTADFHGHDDGQTYNGDKTPKKYTPQNDDTQNFHGHDDGNTYNPQVHGHDDGNDSRARSGPLRAARQHDDGNTHGHDSSGASVHGHDDGGAVVRSSAPPSRDVSMTMMNVSLTALGCATVAVFVGVISIARRRRVGIFRRQDYVEV